jgi:hypothetical protein
MEPQRKNEAERALKRRVYCTLRAVSTAGRKRRKICITHLQPAIYWSLEWGNVHKLILPDGARSAWYMVIYYITPTNVRWHRNRLTDSEKCSECGRQGTILHRLTECGVRQVIWELTRTRVDRIQGQTRNVYHRNGTFVPVSNCGRDKDIRRSCGLWCVWGLCGDSTQYPVGTALH